MSGIGPGGEPGDDVELSEEPADDLVGVSLGAQPIELGHDLDERLLDVADRVLRVVLALLFETALALEEFFAVEICDRMEDRLAGGRESVRKRDKRFRDAGIS